jgi:hypothetical protein
MRAAQKRGQELGPTSEELAFYHALEVSDTAVKVLGDETLRTIARELVDTVKKNITIDWTVKESVRAKLRVVVTGILPQARLRAGQAGGSDSYGAAAGGVAFGFLTNSEGDKSGRG